MTGAVVRAVRRYDLVVFDFDGTLADSFPWFVGVLNGVAERYGFRPVQPDEVEILRGWDARAIMRHLRVPGWKLPFIASHMRRLMARDVAGIAPFDGVPDLLRILVERGVTVVIVSSNSVDNIKRVLGPDSAGRVALYACGASLFGKPAKFRRILRETGVPASSVLAIGDEVRDIDAARGVGIACGAVTWGYARGDVLADRRPDHLFHRVEEIAALLG